MFGISRESIKKLMIYLYYISVAFRLDRIPIVYVFDSQREYVCLWTTKTTVSLRDTTIITVKF